MQDKAINFLLQIHACRLCEKATSETAFKYVCVLVQDEERQCQGTNQSDKAIQVAGKGTEAGRQEQAWGQTPHLPFQAAVPPTATIHWS